MSEAQLGGCLCGGVRYRLDGPPLTLYACHCTDCQTATGSSFALCMVVPRDAVQLLAGAPELQEVELADGRRKRAHRCPACSTKLWGAPSSFPELLILHAGTLDDTSRLEPVGHIWTRSAQPWIRFAPSSLRFDGQPPDMASLVRAWQTRAAKAAG